MSILKICNKCKEEKNCNNFTLSQLKNKFGRCKECASQYNKKHREVNLDKIKEKDRQKSKKYYQKHKQKILDIEKQKYIKNKEIKCIKNKQYYLKNKNKIINQNQQYYVNNKQKVKNYHNNYYKQKRKNNFNFRLKTCISASINFYLKNGGKNKKKILEHLDYSIDQLKNYLENLFEPWMNWNNYGKYDPKTWDDSDQATWNWQIDHIVPHSTFNYSSMEDEQFKQCWSLNNLRPYSAKDNFMDGVRRVRHF
jgi:hypothetical protein